MSQNEVVQIDNVKPFVNGRVAVFIDAANLYHSQKKLHWRVGYLKLKQVFADFPVVSLRYYTAKEVGNQKQDDYFAILGSLGYVVVSKEIKTIESENGEVFQKGSLDVELALDCFEICDTFDSLFLFSGDSDFAPLLDKLRIRGKRVITISTRGHISRELIERSKYIDLKKMKNLISL